MGFLEVEGRLEPPGSFNAGGSFNDPGSVGFVDVIGEFIDNFESRSLDPYTGDTDKFAFDEPATLVAKAPGDLLQFGVSRGVGFPSAAATGSTDAQTASQSVDAPSPTGTGTTDAETTTQSVGFPSASATVSVT